MTKELRIVHYVNQFLAGVGSEAAANQPVEVRPEPVGAGRALAAPRGADDRIVATVIGGDDDERKAAREAVRDALRELAPDVVVAGPAVGGRTVQPGLPLAGKKVIRIGATGCRGRRSRAPPSRRARGRCCR